MPWIISIHAYGTQFRPSEIDYPFTSSTEPGTIGTEGRYRDKPVPYGSIIIEVPRQIPNNKRIEYIVRTVLPLMPDLKRAGATEWYLNIGRFYSSQCNEAFSTEELKLLASLDCPLHYSAYKVSKKRESELEKELGGNGIED